MTILLGATDTSTPPGSVPVRMVFAGAASLHPKAALELIRRPLVLPGTGWRYGVLRL